MVCIVVILVEYQLTPGRLGTESHEDVIILNKKKNLCIITLFTIKKIITRTKINLNRIVFYNLINFCCKLLLLKNSRI